MSPTAARALAAFRSGVRDYHSMMQAVFPQDAYPKLWRYSHNGGPPIAAMSLARALKGAGLRRYKNTIISNA